MCACVSMHVCCANFLIFVVVGHCLFLLKQMCEVEANVVGPATVS